MLGFFSRLFGGSSSDSAGAVSTDCSKCGLPLADCQCCYVCGASSRYVCPCSVSRAETAQALLDHEESDL